MCGGRRLCAWAGPSLPWSAPAPGRPRTLSAVCEGNLLPSTCLSCPSLSVSESEVRRSHPWIWGKEGAEGDRKKPLMVCSSLYWPPGCRALRELCNVRSASRASTYLVSFCREGVANDLLQEGLSFVRECECQLCI